MLYFSVLACIKVTYLATIIANATPTKGQKAYKRHEAQAETEELVNQISDPKVARKRHFTPCSDLQRYTASAGADEINRGAFPLRASLVPTVPRQSATYFLVHSSFFYSLSPLKNPLTP